MKGFYCTSSAVDSSPVTSNSSSTPSAASYFIFIHLIFVKDCHNFKNMFPDSSIAKQFSCSATKCAYIICFGLAPYFKAVIFKCASELEHLRYFTSVVLGHSSAEVTVRTEELSVSKLLNLSMDGSAVNWKLFNVLQADLKKDFCCTLHTLNKCFKHGNRFFLASIYWLFKDSPAHTEDYLNISLTKELLCKFCKHSWLENVPAVEGALEMWGDLKEIYRRSRKRKPFNNKFFLSVVKLLQPFLTKFQNDLPFLPFLAVDLRNIVVSCLKNFNIMKSEYILKIIPPYKVSLFDFKDKKCPLSSS
ncbi:hypothetical protein PR048_007280 [Dryococelus australis]|uniref:Uncharacterized protein n=1 Tax=Dryococelus australis TaxID=614101 RepID=A0ABQ9IDB5_9NEOP|nr:hypothetical protein PR048_007280 [Dryococelus australis]